MKRDLIDTLLQLAYLEGKITTHGLYEKVGGERDLLVGESPASRDMLVTRLENALSAKVSAREDQLLTIGMFLRSRRKEQSIFARDISSRLGIPPNTYRMLEHDRISPLKISAESWIKLKTLFQLSTQSLVDLIRRTHQVVWYRPSFGETLARYDTRKTARDKPETMRRAAEELYARANLRIPPEELSRLEALIATIQESET